MSTRSDPPPSTPVGEIRSLSVLLGRLMWTLWGPILLIVCASALLTRRGWLTVWDAVFAATVALMLGGRWLEQRSGTATTLYGEPSTPDHFRRYSRRLLVVTATAWVVVNVLSNHVLVRGG